MESLIEEDIVSDATLRNWKRLDTSSRSRLTKRANKVKSTKRILPLEYFCNINNTKLVENILDAADNMRAPIDSVMLSLGINLLKQGKIFFKRHTQNVLSEYNRISTIETFENITLPNDENDFLGLVYQSFLCEGKKNITGTYYTPRHIVKNITGSFNFEKKQIFLDPCCGSGSFLININTPDPERLYGVDKDETAVMIAKINMLLKFSDKEFEPHVYCEDFLEGNTFLGHSEVFEKKFDYIATNPPWGSKVNPNFVPEEITSKEAFSCFFVKAYELLKRNGIIRFLFPEAILNVKTHTDIRRFILNNLKIIGITEYNSMFSGVTTKYVDIECADTGKEDSFNFNKESDSQVVPISAVYETENLIFNFLNKSDEKILQSVKNKGKYSLKHSVWALGVVTGDNKNKLFAVPQAGMEKIYTGKDITPYFLKPAKNFILYDRKNLQQTAKDEIYRADEKLVYKFISKKLVFAYDNSKSLFLNSANILIPKIPNMTIKTVMAFLNSELFQFLYMKLFGEVKILKGNLSELLFPNLTCERNLYIDSMVGELLNGDVSKESEIQMEIYKIYSLTDKEIEYVRRTVNGKAY